MNKYNYKNKQLLFDLDGTLLNHKASAELAFKCCFSDRLSDRDITDEHKQYWFYLEEKYMREFLDGKLSFRDQRKQRIKDFILKYSQQVVIDNLDSLEAQYLEYYVRNWISYPEVIQCFLDLQKIGCSIVILSNGEKQQQLRKVAALKLPFHVDVFTPEDIGFSKPDKEAFIRVCEVLEAKLEDSFYIGDNFETDYLASKRAGMKAVLVDRMSQYKSFMKDTDIVINSLEKLPKIIKDSFKE